MQYEKRYEEKEMEYEKEKKDINAGGFDVYVHVFYVSSGKCCCG